MGNKAMTNVLCSLTFLIEHEATRLWLDKLKGTTFNHGFELVEALGKAGRPDNVWEADKVLLHLESEGVIERWPGMQPTLSQQVMGHGGLWWREIKRLPLDQQPPSFFGWRPGKALREGYKNQDG